MKLINLLKPATLRDILLISALLAAGALATALMAQYGFLLHPCHLCLLQRYPYALIIAVGLAGAYLIKNPTRQRHLVLLCALLFLGDAAIAGYHAGVELDIFKGPDGCSASDSGAQTLEEMRAAILNAPLVSCKQAMAHVFGLSLAAWNMIAATWAGIFVFWRWKKIP